MTGRHRSPEPPPRRWPTYVVATGAALGVVAPLAVLAAPDADPARAVEPPAAVSGHAGAVKPPGRLVIPSIGASGAWEPLSASPAAEPTAAWVSESPAAQPTFVTQEIPTSPEPPATTSPTAAAPPATPPTTGVLSMPTTTEAIATTTTPPAVTTTAAPTTEPAATETTSATTATKQRGRRKP